MQKELKSEIDIIFEKMFNYYNVSSIKDLADKIDLGTSTVSNWRQRGSTSAIKKRCRELNIYKDIFPGNDNVDLSFDPDTARLLEIVKATIQEEELKIKFHDTLKTFVKENM